MTTTVDAHDDFETSTDANKVSPGYVALTVYVPDDVWGEGSDDLYGLVSNPNTPVSVLLTLSQMDRYMAACALSMLRVHGIELDESLAGQVSPWLDEEDEGDITDLSGWVLNTDTANDQATPVLVLAHHMRGDDEAAAAVATQALRQRGFDPEHFVLRPELAAMTAHQLGRLMSGWDISPLMDEDDCMALATHPNWNVRESVAMLNEMCNDEALAKVLASDPAVMVREQLVENGDCEVRVLVGLLDDSEETVVEAARYNLSENLGIDPNDLPDDLDAV